MKTISLFILLALTAFVASAQLSIERQVIASTGRTLESGTLSQDFTLGETLISTLTSGTIHLTQGFQQGNLGPTSSAASLLQDNEWVVYPQPARENLFIRLTRPHAKPIQLEVFDLMGRSLHTDHSAFATNPTLSHVEVEAWPTGTYLLRLIDEGGQLLFQSKWTKH